MLLNSNQLDQVCRYLSGQTFETFEGFTPPDRQFDDKQTDFLFILYQTGLRYVELFDISRWAPTFNDIYEVTTAKGSNKRYISIDQITPGFSGAIGSNLSYWHTCRFDSLCFYISKNLTPKNLITSSKFLSTHIFRHNKVKLLDKDGLTTQEIADYLGEVSLSNVLMYLNSVIRMI